MDISQILGHEDGNMALDVYSGGLAIEPLRESINKLTYGSGMDLLIKKLVICLKNTQIYVFAVMKEKGKVTYILTKTKEDIYG